MPLELVKGDITQFRENSFSYQELVFEDSSVNNSNKHDSKESKTSYVSLKNEKSKKSGNESKENEKPLSYCDSIISSVTIRKYGAPQTPLGLTSYSPLGVTLIIITMPKLTEEMFSERYGRYQNIFTVTVFTGQKDLGIYCYVNLCHQAQFALLCEFIKKYSADFFETFKQLMPAPRQTTSQEDAFKLSLQTLNQTTFKKLLSAAQNICQTKQNTYYANDSKSWDALWVLANACLNKGLLQEAYDAFEAIPEDNWYRESADYQITHMALENINFTGMNPKKKHQALKDHLMTFFKDFDLERLADFGAIAWKLIEFSGCKVTDFGTSSGLTDFFPFLLKLADLHYLLQKNTVFKPKVSYSGLFEEYSNLFEKNQSLPSTQKTKLLNDNTSELIFENWQVEGNFNDFVKNEPEPNSVNFDKIKELRFVNKSTPPHFCTAIELTRQQSNKIFLLQIFLPEGTHESFSELYLKYQEYNTIFHVVYSGDDQKSQGYRLLVAAGLSQKRVKKFFDFLQDKIPSNIWEKLRQCISARKPTDDEQEFDEGLKKLDGVGKTFADLLKLAQKISKTDNDDDNEALFLLGKKCLEVGLLDKAYEAFSCIKHHAYTAQAHLAMSKILLDKIQINPNVTADENHKTVGEGLIKYDKVSTDKDFDSQAWGALFEKIKIYAGLESISTSKQEKSSKQEIVSEQNKEDKNPLKIIELMLELAERIYLLKENIKQKSEPKKVDLNNNDHNNNLLMLSTRGQQVVDSTKSTTTTTTTPSVTPTEKLRKKREKME